MKDLTTTVIERCELLSTISEEPGIVVRPYGSQAMDEVNNIVAGWMQMAGMNTRRDAIGNHIGRYEGEGEKTLILGSHLDTVRDAGKYDGILGVMVAFGGNSDALERAGRGSEDLLGYCEVHIEQGPVLNDLDLPLGVVTSINGGVRHVGEVVGMASHAGTTPMNARRDAAMAVAELGLYLEQRASQEPDLVGTMGQLSVPNGSINVVPGRCRFSLDIRSTTDPVRDRCVADVLARLQAICERRGVDVTLEETMRAAAAPCDPAWRARWSRAVESIGLPPHAMPSGAGHDAMKLHEAMPQAMLFVRGEHFGISHNPLESSTNDDIQLAVEAYRHLLDGLAKAPSN
jgi:hydantoinase/carbamoylase family amidase